MAEAAPTPGNTPNGELQPVLAGGMWGSEERQQEAPASRLVEENMRLKTRHSQLQDQLEELKRQLHAERSTRQGLDAEVNEVKERLRRTKDVVDQQKKDHSEVSLRLCTVTAERDELEAKVGEVWSSMAAVEETVRFKEIENKALREALDNEQKERAAQEVLMSAMVAQIAALEQQVAAGEGAEVRHRRLSEDALRGVKEEVQRISLRLESLADLYSASALERDVDQRLLWLSAGDIDYDGVANYSAGEDYEVGTTGDGLNTSDSDKRSRGESRVKRTTQLMGPIYPALRHLHQQLQCQHEERRAMQHERRVLESHIAALKEELHHLGNDGDDVRERLLRSEAQRAQLAEALENTRQVQAYEVAQLAETRCKLASHLRCVGDWCVIEQHITDLVKEAKQLRSDVEEGHRTHRAYVAQKESEMDAMMDLHQREMNEQQQKIEQFRHECERLKRAAESAAIDVTAAGGVSTELQRDHEVFKVKYQDMMRYMEEELEPLVAEQAKALQEERRRVDELRRANDALGLEMKIRAGPAADSGGRLTLFEALVLTLRVLSGAMADMREMSQQRKALTRYVLAYEQMFGALNACGDFIVRRPVLRFRRIVVAVLAAQRLTALRKAVWRCGGGGVIPSMERGTARIRLPPETCCLVRGGLIRLPPVRGDDAAADFLSEEAGTKGGDGSDVAFVAERELVLPIMTHTSSNNTSLGEVYVQGCALRNFMSALLAFVTVPSAMWPLRDVREPLWRRLAHGMCSLQRASMQVARLGTLGKPHSLLHLPPRAPARSQVALPWGESLPRPPQSYGVTVTQRLPLYDHESAGATTKRTARGQTASFGHAQGMDVKRASTAYPTPQPTVHAEDTLSLEEALRQSLLRDEQFSSDPQEIQAGSGFASEVLNVIRALDQRVVGALERHMPSAGRRPHP
ncbi:hypothetical protein TraAM80_01965 [Trypanosoma rangeli]|uniref:Uncharacterized protein n=1 Tax=Trypanosoma rangeli TaxID=5698 RepID=A0A3S5IS49_TRYRA|nr:uncharacterized protein TraAM80_01965 [Trypanosoma rangeli]RNF09913.1 hypothetical protein TraAM80_01965 [Trypanosoma rangeli]|eukprot:RNF09913.1 hypothetical protein TraAM80_01965 [Trypanosoma rangeli]